MVQALMNRLVAVCSVQHCAGCLRLVSGFVVQLMAVKAYGAFDV